MWLISLVACTGDQPFSWPDLEEAPPMAGAAEGDLLLPIGTPMGGFSSRTTYLGGTSKPDQRKSPYAKAFVPSAGKHQQPGIKAIWIEAGDQDLVITQTDTIYSFDGIVSALESELTERTGRPMYGRVVHTTNHSHNSYGPFSDQIHFFLGGDRYNEEIFERFVSMVADVAVQAYESRANAEIGTAWAKDWDPTDAVYHDRRNENNEVVMFDDLPPGGTGKDPYLNILRVDNADTGAPIAMAYTFGVHGTMVGEDSALLTSDASGGIDMRLEEAFDTPVVVMHMQSGAGDASPGGVGDGLSRVESLGVLAVDPIMELYESTPVSSAPIKLETARRHIWQARDMIAVTRNGTTDMRYTPYDPNVAPDLVLYDENGEVAAPIDEFNAEYGAAFCGGGDPLLAAGFIGADIYPYSSCTDVGLISRLVYGIFEVTEAEYPLPFNESLKAGTMAAKITSLPTLLPDGTTVDQPLFAGFFPGEPTAMFTEQARRRVEGELGYDMPLIVGYSMDHEGYLLPPEDWLAGGYEPNINIWGPLQGEHIMEGVLQAGADVLATDDVAEDPDPFDYYAPTSYATHPLPTEYQPDLTEDAGTVIDAEHAPTYLWVPPGFVPEYGVQPQVARVQGIVQLVWKGGDPMVDLPQVVLEMQDGADWVPVQTHSGRDVTSRYTDILLSWTPDPLYPADAVQNHYWWAAFQAVDHTGEPAAGLPAGTYRLHVQGKRYTGGSTQWPWATADYDVASDPFEIVPAEITLTVDGEGLWASLHGPAAGWRFLDLEGLSAGDNPVHGPLEVQLTSGDEVEPLNLTEDRTSGGRSHIAVDLTGVCRVQVRDEFGNTGVLELSVCEGG